MGWSLKMSKKKRHNLKLQSLQSSALVQFCLLYLYTHFLMQTSPSRSLKELILSQAGMQPKSEAELVLLSLELYLMSRVRVPSASARSIIRNKSIRKKKIVNTAKIQIQNSGDHNFTQYNKFLKSQEIKIWISNPGKYCFSTDFEHWMLRKEQAGNCGKLWDAPLHPIFYMKLSFLLKAG